MKNTEMVKFSANSHVYTFNLDTIQRLVNDYERAVKARRGKDTVPTQNALEKLSSVYNVAIEDVPALYMGMSQYLKEQENKEQEQEQEQEQESKLYNLISKFVKENNKLPNDNEMSTMFSECSVIYSESKCALVKESYLKLAKTGKYALVVTESPKKDTETNKAYNAKLPVASVIENSTSEADKARALDSANKRKAEQEKALAILEKQREELVANNYQTVYVVKNGLNVFDKACRAWTSHIALYFQRETMKDIINTRWRAIDRHYTKEIDSWESAIEDAESNHDDNALKSAEMHYHDTVYQYDRLVERKKSAFQTINKIWGKNKADRALESAIKNGCSVSTAIRSMFLEYGIDIDPNGKFMLRFLEYVNSKERNRDKAEFYNGNVWRANGKALDQVYIALFDILFKAGIIKKCGVPVDIMTALEAIHNKDKEYTFEDVPATFDDLSAIFEQVQPALAEIDRKIECAKNALKTAK